MYHTLFSQIEVKCVVSLTHCHTNAVIPYNSHKIGHILISGNPLIGVFFFAEWNLLCWYSLPNPKHWHFGWFHWVGSTESGPGWQAVLSLHCHPTCLCKWNTQLPWWRLQCFCHLSNGADDLHQVAKTLPFWVVGIIHLEELRKKQTMASSWSSSFTIMHMQVKH